MAFAIRASQPANLGVVCWIYSQMMDLQSEEDGFMEDKTQDRPQHPERPRIPKWDQHPGFQEVSPAEWRASCRRVNRQFKKLMEMLART